MTTDDVSKQTPQEFFETIGNKVKNLAPAAEGEQNDDDDHRAVEEIESLCMNCGENVSRVVSRVLREDQTLTHSF